MRRQLVVRERARLQGLALAPVPVEVVPQLAGEAQAESKAQAWVSLEV
jgi:hypothetical protein